jgi:hypothetical protein
MGEILSEVLTTNLDTPAANVTSRNEQWVNDIIDDTSAGNENPSATLRRRSIPPVDGVVGTENPSVALKKVTPPVDGVDVNFGAEPVPSPLEDNTNDVEVEPTYWSKFTKLWTRAPKRNEHSKWEHSRLDRLWIGAGTDNQFRIKRMIIDIIFFLPLYAILHYAQVVLSKVKLMSEPSHIPGESIRLDVFSMLLKVGTLGIVDMRTARRYQNVITNVKENLSSLAKPTKWIVFIVKNSVSFYYGYRGSNSVETVTSAAAGIISAGPGTANVNAITHLIKVAKYSYDGEGKAPRPNPSANFRIKNMWNQVQKDEMPPIDVPFVLGSAYAAYRSTQVIRLTRGKREAIIESLKNDKVTVHHSRLVKTGKYPKLSDYQRENMIYDLAKDNIKMQGSTIIRVKESQDESDIPRNGRGDYDDEDPDKKPWDDDNDRDMDKFDYDDARRNDYNQAKLDRQDQYRNSADRGNAKLAATARFGHGGSSKSRAGLRKRGLLFESAYYEDKIAAPRRLRVENSIEEIIIPAKTPVVSAPTPVAVKEANYGGLMTPDCLAAAYNVYHGNRLVGACVLVRSHMVTLEHVICDSDGVAYAIGDLSIGTPQERFDIAWNKLYMSDEREVNGIQDRFVFIPCHTIKPVRRVKISTKPLNEGHTIHVALIRERKTTTGEIISVGRENDSLFVSTTTSPGDSGSPVFDNDGNLYGLHWGSAGTANVVIRLLAADFRVGPTTSAKVGQLSKDTLPTPRKSSNQTETTPPTPPKSTRASRRARLIENKEGRTPTLSPLSAPVAPPPQGGKGSQPRPRRQSMSQ